MADVTLGGTTALSPDLQRAYEAALEAERRPVKALANNKAEWDKRLELLGDIVGRVDGVRSQIPLLNSERAIRDPFVNSSHAGVVTGTADKELAAFGSHGIEVMRLASPASALSNGFPDKDETRIGSGYFSFTTVDGEERDVFVDNEDATLDGLARILNEANLGVRASVVNDTRDLELPWRLVLTHDGTGTPNNVDYPVFYFVDGEEELYLETEKEAQNSLFRYEGMEIESPTNDIEGLIRGVTVNLKGISDSGRPAKLTIAQDIPKTQAKIKELVDGINSVFSFIQEQNLSDENTPRGTLAGDYALRFAERRLQDALHENYLYRPGRKVRALSDIGVEFNKKGTLEFDEKKFENALNANFNEVVDLLVGDGKSTGVVTRLSSALNSISSGRNALLTLQKTNATNRVKAIQEDIQDKERQVAEKANVLKVRLLNAQSAIDSLQRQTAGFTAAANQSPFPMLR